MDSSTKGLSLAPSVFDGDPESKSSVMLEESTIYFGPKTFASLCNDSHHGHKPIQGEKDDISER